MHIDIYSAAVLEKNKLKDAFPYRLINLAQFVVGGVFFFIKGEVKVWTN